MVDRQVMRLAFRKIVDDGGDIVDVALAARSYGWGKHSIHAAAALRDEFALPVKEAVAFAAWIGDDTETNGALDLLRAGVPTALR